MQEAKAAGEEESIDQASVFESLDRVLKSGIDGKLGSKALNGYLDIVTRLSFDLEDAAIRAQRREAAERRLKKQAEKQKKIRDVTSYELPLDWKNAFEDDERVRGIHTESVQDALVLSFLNLGRVDIEFIASVTGKDCRTVIGSLKGAIYQNPETWDECFYKGWEISEEYLSGNLKYKLDKAREASERYHGYFDGNVRMLKSLLPPLTDSKDIYVTLGSPWVPADVIDSFIEHLFGPLPPYSYYNRELLNVRHDELTGTWEIPQKNRYGSRVGVTSTYGTTNVNALYIIEKSLNMKKITVKREVVDLSGIKKNVTDEEQTLAVEEKQKKLIAEFRKWVWSDKDRKKRLEQIFTDRYCSSKKRIFDGSFLTFPGLSADVKLKPFQKDTVARIIFSPNTLIAHEVGSGKTYEMIAAGQEMLRMGISKSNMYVVPNNITGQWKNFFSKMYPDAKVLYITPENFTVRNRNGILRSIRDGEYSSIIIAYSCFGLIPLSKSFYYNELKAKSDTVNKALQESNMGTAALRRKRDNIAKEAKKIDEMPSDSHSEVYFDQLGITRLFVDEAQNFKNLPVETKATPVLGLSANGSHKCEDMLNKVHLVQRNNNGKGVVLATGTPITNSITDAYAIQMYLQSGELNILGLQSFDSWLGMFAERKTDFEIDVDTSTYRMATRLSKFHNLPELAAILSQIADFHKLDQTSGIPEHDGYIDCLIPKSPDFEDYLKDISYRVDSIRNGLVDRTEDNMLKVTVDGRKAALDMRLVNPAAPFSIYSKVQSCAENVHKIYEQTQKDRSTQIVFCDVSTPREGFNIYDELKRLLVYFGIPADEIKFIHDAATDKARDELFEKVRNGEVRVIIGSTFKLGIGVNIQERLIALHHIDVPWRPSDMVQREGRILRHGNRNSKVSIYRYITDGSFDAYSWQLLETKQRFIDSLLSGCVSERSENDVSDTVLDYAEVKALAVGNPLMKKRVETYNELNRLISLQQSAKAEKLKLENERTRLPEMISEKRAYSEKCSLDCSYSSRWEEENAAVEVSDKEEAERRRSVREHLAEGLKGHVLQISEKKLMSYRGFDVILPSNMSEDKPYVYLAHEGKYRVDLGDSEKGNLMRIDNFLDSFPDYCSRAALEVETLCKRLSEIDRELAEMQNIYSDKIEKQRKKLGRIDKKLGVGANV